MQGKVPLFFKTLAMFKMAFLCQTSRFWDSLASGPLLLMSVGILIKWPLRVCLPDVNFCIQTNVYHNFFYSNRLAANPESVLAEIESLLEKHPESPRLRLLVGYAYIIMVYAKDSQLDKHAEEKARHVGLHLNLAVFYKGHLDSSRASNSIFSKEPF